MSTSTLTSMQDLVDAIKDQRVELVRKYLADDEVKLDINELVVDERNYQRTPLHWAVLRNTGVAIMELLLAKGADMEIGDEYGTTPFIDAAESPERMEHLQCLLKHGAKVNYYCTERKCTALHSVCKAANVAAVRILLEHGADVLARDELGRTPLQMAAQASDYENATTCLQVLLDHGADITTRDNRGRTLLHHAIYGKEMVFTFLSPLIRNAPLLTESISFLLDKKKIDLDATDVDGNTVLHYCVDYLGYQEPDVCHKLTQMLLGHGAQIQIKNQKLETVFHLALKYDELDETVRLLLAHLDLQGMDRHSILSLTDDKGLTAFQYARYRGGAQSLLEQLTNNGEDILPCSHELFFAKNGEGITLLQEVQANLDRRTSNGFFLDTENKLLLLEYLKSFTENALSVPESGEHGTSAIAVRINPLLNDFQRVLAHQMLRMSLTCPTVSANVMKDLPESLKLVTMGYLAPADVMKRNPNMKTGGTS